MENTFTAINAFNDRFNQIETVLEFNPEWKNGTGYFDHMAEGEHAPVLEHGAMAKSVDTFGRRIVVVGTRLGNVIVFTRYGDWSENSNAPVVINVPNDIKQTMGVFDGAQTYDSIQHLLGAYSWDNIGQKLEHLYKCFTNV